MLGYLEKFNKLPQELRDEISSPETMEIINVLEKKYGVNLATVVMRVMVKEIGIEDLAKYFVFEDELDNHRAGQLTEELKNQIFYKFADYLGIKIVEEKNISQNNFASNNIQIKTAPAAPSNSGFFFSTEDEDEVRELSKKVEGFTQSRNLSKQQEDQTNEKIELIRKQIGVNFSSDDLNSRFLQVMKTYLKGVRNKIDTKQTLIKPVDNGGLGMDEIFSDNVLLVADRVNKNNDTIKSSPDTVKPPNTEIKVPERKLAEDKKLSSDSLRNSGIRDIDYDFSALPKDKASEEKTFDLKISSEQETSPSKLETINLSGVEGNNKISKVVPRVNNSSIDIQQKNYQKVDDSNFSKTKSPDTVYEKSLPANMANARRSASVDSKRRMDDVKYVPKLVGPVEELGEMNLINFRRLSQNPVVAANKIKEKLGFLEEEGYDKKLAGIKAWRQSPVNSLYLLIAQESINKKISIDEVINQRMSVGGDCLTRDEIEAIMELNKDLRF